MKFKNNNRNGGVSRRRGVAEELNEDLLFYEILVLSQIEKKYDHWS